MSVFRPIKVIKDSRLYERLLALESKENEESGHEDGDVARLKLNVKAVVTNAEEISKHVIAYMPQYTLHDGKHLWNVLSYAEELAGESIQEFGALECALLLMAVFVHDLGMVPDAEEERAWEDSNAKTPEAEAWQTYCAGHPLWTQREKLPVEKEKERKQLLGKVRADYLRETHADEAKPLGGLNRINRWLERLEGFDPKLLEYRGLNYREPLALLAMSHGQSVDWLPERLTTCKEMSLEKGDVYHHDVGGEHVNWPYLSWLLRLADIMDFDASRTPAVVFEHLGIDDAVSVREWQKHLSIASVSFLADAEGPKVRYVCNKCPSPRVEKAIHEFVGWINLELGHVATEQARGSRHYESRKETLQLKLPEKAEVKINAREGNYEYLDVSFTLERDAVMELLMGEALYGDHNLALRELVQNALDALHLRDMRSQLREKLREAGRLHDAPPVEPVGTSEKLEVHVTWGHDKHDRAWIKVKDNGVGMTKGQIEKFLTRIGKSYYKSPEFKREQKLMKEHGLLCTTISQFGIGFLSCFMLADKVEVVTRAGGRGGEDDHGRRVVVDGSHGMIAIYPVKRDEGTAVDGTGTEVTLWLKKELSLAPWDRNAVIRELQYRHYAINESSGWRNSLDSVLDPVLELGLCLVWPMYPVRFGTELLEGGAIVMDESFHFRELLKLSDQKLKAKADEWKVEVGGGEGLIWDAATWEDQDVTGSRLRYAVARIHGQSRNFDQWRQRSNMSPESVPQTLLLSLVEPQLPSEGRTKVLVNGIVVPDLGGLNLSLLVEPGAGACCWIDLRGEAAPRLRADRRATTMHQSEQLRMAAHMMLMRARQALQPTTLDIWRWLTLAIRGEWESPEPEQHWPNPIEALGFPTDPGFWCAVVSQLWSIAGYFEFRSKRSRALDRESVGNYALNQIVDSRLARTVARALAAETRVSRETAIQTVRSRSRNFAGLVAGAPNVTLFPAFDCFLKSNWLSDGTGKTTMAALECLAPLREGEWLSNLYHKGPIELSRQSIAIPRWMLKLKYDLIAPWTGVPHGRLRHVWKAIKSKRKLRSKLVMPFLLGDEAFGVIPTKLLCNGVELSDLLLWMPHPRQMGWRFEDAAHSYEDWNEGSLSALWDIEKGTVVYAPGLHDRESIRKVGVSLNKLLGIKK